MTTVDIILHIFCHVADIFYCYWQLWVAIFMKKIQPAFQVF
jgi:hypothetical protein